jgi:hypothetical protein
MKLCLAVIAFALFHAGVWSSHAQPSVFTFQGRLGDQGAPATGLYDLKFTLFDAPVGGTTIGAANVVNDATISNGLFSVVLDYGGEAFDGNGRWLEISVRPGNSSAAYTNLAPRQLISASPYALYAGSVRAAGISGAIPASQISGKLTEAQLPANVARLFVTNTAQQATGVPVVTATFITSANVTFGGFGYTSAPVVTVLSATGSNAFITSTISNSAVIGLTVQNAGSGYSPGATLTIAPPPNNAFQNFSGTNVFTGVNSFVSPSNQFVGTFAGNGAGLTGINASNLTGILPDARLSGNVAFRSRDNLFVGTQSFGGSIGIGIALPQAKLHILGGDLLAGASGEEWIYHTRSQAAGDFLQITDLDAGVPQFQRGLTLTESGNAGIGTTGPGAKLDVRGNIRLGNNGEYLAAASGENLRIVRGTVSGAGGIILGTGFTVSRTSAGRYTITFTTPFSGTPTVTATTEHDPGIIRSCETDGVTTTTAIILVWNVSNLASTVDGPFHFTAIGAR